MPGRIEHLDVNSQLLRGNPQGDPHVRTLPVYLPPGYDPARRYPVVFVLAGYTSTGPALLNHRGWGENSKQRLDRLIDTGDVPPIIAAFPDCWTRLGGSQYIDSAGTGPYMSHVVQELVPLVRRRFLTIEEPSGLAVTGISSGGYGALMLAMERPGTFGLVAATAADCGFDLCYRPDLPKLVMALEAAGGLQAFLDEFFSSHKLSGEQITAMMMVAMAACYSPTLEGPIYGELPVDLHTAELREEVWQRWLDNDPVHRVRRRGDALSRLSLLSLDAGRRDEYQLQFGHRILARQLTAMSIPFVFEEFSDGHRGIGYRQAHAFKRIGECIETS